MSREEILKKYATNAIQILKDKAKVADLLQNAESQIKSQKYSVIFTRVNDLIKYLVSPDVPIDNKIKIVAGLLYIISPISIPGFLDELILGVYLIPYILTELDKFQQNVYVNASGRDLATYEGNPLLELIKDEMLTVNDSNSANYDENSARNHDSTINPLIDLIDKELNKQIE